MTEKGRITRIEGKQATISCADAACGSEECFGCHNAGGIREYQAWNLYGLDLRAGDSVEIGSRGAGASALLLLVLPLALLFVSYALLAVAFPLAGQGGAVAAGLGGFALGVLIALLVRRRKGPEDMPIVVRKLAGAEAALDTANSGEPALEYSPFE